MVPPRKSLPKIAARHVGELLHATLFMVSLNFAPSLSPRGTRHMSAFHHLTEVHALALGGVPMAFLRNETSHSRRDSARSPKRA
jgi:hypothetical protein